MVYKNEEGYLQLLSDIMECGVDVPSRSGNCRVLLGVQLEYDDFCMSTVRPAPMRMAFEELWFFLNGKTQTKELEDKGINFWKGNTSREFLDSRDLDYLMEGDLGAAYSCQWRNFGGYEETVAEVLGTGEYSNGLGGRDQLKDLILTLSMDKHSRRNLVSLWNPAENNYGALTPCWFANQWFVLPDKKTGEDTLHCHLFSRSNDALFGATFALQQYRLLQLVLCKMFNFKMGKLKASISNVHIYENQFEYVAETLSRKLGKQGYVKLNKEVKDLNDLLNLQWEDFEVIGLEVNNEEYVSDRPAMAV